MSLTLLDIVFLVVLALFLILKLRSILGKENELDLLGQKEASFPFKKRTIIDITPEQKDTKVDFAPLNARYTPSHSDIIEEDAKQGFAEIQKDLQDLTPTKFISVAAEVLFLMLESYDAGKIDPIKNLVSSQIFSNLQSALKIEQDTKIKERISIVKILDAKILSASNEGGICRVSILFKTRQSQYTQMMDSPNTTAEHKEALVDAADVWEFFRNKNDESASWIVSSIVSEYHA